MNRFNYRFQIQLAPLQLGRRGEWQLSGDLRQRDGFIRGLGGEHHSGRAVHVDPELTLG